MSTKDEAPRGPLERVRSICLGLPDTIETVTYGNATWKTGRKTFAVFEKYRGDWSIALKAEPGEQRALIETDPRFYRTPYIGHRGWVSFRLQGRIPWRHVRALLREAHRLA